MADNEMRGPAPRIFLTGASSGIGAAFARHYAAQGATLGLAARRGEQLEQLARSLPNALFDRLFVRAGRKPRAAVAP